MLAPVLALALAAAGPARLSFAELLEADPSQLAPSRRALELDGRRVRIVGFMAQMEIAPEGAFYLCARPVTADEAGGGTADLPVAAVRVISPASKGRPVRFIPGPLEVTGTLQVGRRAEEDGSVSHFRILLDRTAPRAKKATHSTQGRRQPRP
jgi:hypothetical protein